MGGPEGDLPITLEESEARLTPVETGTSHLLIVPCLQRRSRELRGGRGWVTSR